MWADINWKFDWSPTNEEFIFTWESMFGLPTLKEKHKEEFDQWLTTKQGPWDKVLSTLLNHNWVLVPASYLSNLL